MSVREHDALRHQLLEAHDAWSKAIFRHLSFRVRDRERVLELTQEVFLRAWQMLSRGEKVENMRALLYRIARNLTIDEYRKPKTESLDALTEATDFEPVDPREENLVDQLDGARMRELVLKLEPLYREPLVYRYIDDLAVKEIASLLGETENVISVRLHRGLAKLRELILKS